jgi:hypothetical protein
MIIYILYRDKMCRIVVAEELSSTRTDYCDIFTLSDINLTWLACDRAREWRVMREPKKKVYERQRERER